MFSKACEYGMRAMMFVAQKSDSGERAGIRDIAKSIDAPEHFVAKILQDLSRKGLVQSVKGPNGGFFLDNEHRKVTLADVVSAIDGEQLFTGCALGLHVCHEKKPCPLHDEFKIIRAKLRTLLETTRVGEFNDSLQKGFTYLKRS